ncbi:MAG: hypothetical protein MH204_08030 [Fimbriimonadaceae bacterium]|nr:hypothetical protein [Fimbriimonadaceae bacterium]
MESGADASGSSIAAVGVTRLSRPLTKEATDRLESLLRLSRSQGLILGLTGAALRLEADGLMAVRLDSSVPAEAELSGLYGLDAGDSLILLRPDGTEFGSFSPPPSASEAADLVEMVRDEPAILASGARSDATMTDRLRMLRLFILQRRTAPALLVWKRLGPEGWLSPDHGPLLRELMVQSREQETLEDLILAILASMPAVQAPSAEAAMTAFGVVDAPQEVLSALSARSDGR